MNAYFEFETLSWFVDRRDREREKCINALGKLVKKESRREPQNQLLQCQSWEYQPGTVAASQPVHPSSFTVIQ